MKKIFLFLSLALLVSCNQEELPQKQTTPIVKENSFKVGKNDMRPLQNLTPFSIILVFEHYWLTCSLYF